MTKSKTANASKTMVAIIIFGFYFLSFYNWTEVALICFTYSAFKVIGNRFVILQWRCSIKEETE